jgi:hypothetical protein
MSAVMLGVYAPVIVGCVFDFEKVVPFPRSVLSFELLAACFALISRSVDLPQEVGSS